MPDIVNIRKTRKDCSIEEDTLRLALNLLQTAERLLLPVDGLYGTITPFDPQRHQQHEMLVAGILSAEKASCLSKAGFDFLHRIWPDEISVILDGNTAAGYPETVTIRQPRLRYMQQILEHGSRIMAFTPALSKNGKHIFRKKDLKQYADEHDCPALIIDEFNKSHMPPTVIDIRCGKLRLMQAGRVSFEEIVSLYQLGTNDEE
jgi:tRNA A37 threonylcarbamoyladenosine synthetase subunit TsaC/SUA5/YrdC